MKHGGSPVFSSLSVGTKNVSVDLRAGRGNCAALSLEPGLDLRKGAVVGQDLPFAGHIAVHQDEARQEDFVAFILKYTRI
jgi:hypothetical protein